MSLNGHEHTYDTSKVQGYDAKLDRIENLIANQKSTFEKIYQPKVNGYDTPSFHYDWWLFPVEMPRDQYWSDTAAFYSLNPVRTATLLANEGFVNRYCATLNLYLLAQTVEWNGYEVRLGKVLLSLIHFIQATKNDDKLKSLNSDLVALARTSLEVVNHNKLHQDNFPYNAYHQMNHLLSEFQISQDTGPKSKKPIF